MGKFVSTTDFFSAELMNNTNNGKELSNCGTQFLECVLTRGG